MTLLRRLDVPVDPAAAFTALYGDSPTAFWLDSSRPDLAARFSFMGDAAGPRAATVSYDVEAGEVTVERGGETETRAEPVLDYLERELVRLRPLAADLDPADLPFEFDCGFVGYLGYELKADCGSPNTHSSPHPDAALILADRLLAFDHQQNHTYLLCLCDPETKAAGETWLSTTASRLRELGARPRFEATGEGLPEPPRRRSADPSPVAPQLARSHTRYLEDIAACQERLLEGESYEICLTNALEAEVEADPLELYASLRRLNPAPFASYLRFGDLAVLSSSPERFLRIDRSGEVETKPIKGTARRAASPAEDVRLAEELRTSEKNRAENLMIVDLMRNDLGRVCAIGSVEVPALMEVETYETVHQLVSTVRGHLREGASVLDCVRSCFPPGSMTGAPKLRTMEILDELEGRARGVYSGAIGYLGLGGGCELSVTIRTIVLDRGSASIGAGGAIVLQSEAEQEHEEMLLKAAAPMFAIAAGPGPTSISLPDPRRPADSPSPASAHDLTS